VGRRKLKWRTTERKAVTHRGVYVATLSQDGTFAYAHLRQHDGVYESVGTCPRTLDEAQRQCAEHAAVQPAWPPMLGWPALFALCLLVLTSCADAHGRIEGPPLYMHLCDAMPAADQDAWGAAVADVNAELPEPAVWVGHGPTRGCNTIDVCPGEHAETHIGTCVITVRYAPGSAGDVARGELEQMLWRLP
jgi:hypothetical protein